MAGKGLVARPNWRVQAGANLYIPEVDSAGFLSTDYLVVTRLRNFLSPEALDEGKFLVSFGGAHGTATRAVEILLRDTATLAAIARKVKDHSCYQFVLRAGRMSHDQQRGTRATAVELVREPVLLPDRTDIWHAASRIAAANLAEWLRPRGEQS